MMKVFGPAVGELMAALAAQGVEPVGAVFVYPIKMSPDIFDFQLGVKVSDIEGRFAYEVYQGRAIPQPAR